MPSAWAARETNLLVFSNGALIERVSSEYGGAWLALWLFDADGTTRWATEKDKQLPVEIVIWMPERSEIRRLEFDTARTETPDRSARDVDVLVSDDGVHAD